jgi:hypothetical protein
MRWIGLICGAALIAGCVSNKPNRVFLDHAPIGEAGQAGVLAAVLFPDYFLIDGVELHEHGHIPRTQLIGAGMSISLDLASVRSRFNDQLYFHKWTTDKMEMGPQSFRILASHEGETVEIRGVRGTSGPTHIFLLYSVAVE